MGKNKNPVWLFADESGDLGHRTGSTHFVITVLYANFKPKKYKALAEPAIDKHKSFTRINVDELKGHDMRNFINRTVLRDLCDWPVSVESVIYDIRTNLGGYMHDRQGDIHLKMLSGVIKTCRIDHYDPIYVILDEGERQGYSKQEFNDALRTRLLEKWPTKTIFVNQQSSKTSYGIQVVDVVCWAIRRIFELDDTQWLTILKPILNRCLSFTIEEPEDIFSSKESPSERT